MRKAHNPDVDLIATDDMFRADNTATLQRLAADTQPTALGLFADKLLHSLCGDNPPTDDDGIALHRRMLLAQQTTRKRRARPTSISTS
jgi:hypothetical protein